MLDLYNNIKEKRKELHMTQSELAEKMGYADKSMISRIEKGEIDLQQSKIIAFAKILKINPGDLMGWETEKEPLHKFSPQLNSIISKSNQLNSKGLEALEKHIDLLLLSEEYKKVDLKEEVM